MKLKQAKHAKPDKKGYCRRCALPMHADGGRCPPGFWMTKYEIAEWQTMGPIARRDFEKECAAKRV